MTKKQALWAMQHDWALSMFAVAKDRWVVLVKETSIAADRTVITTEKTFEDFKELKAWAGY